MSKTKYMYCYSRKIYEYLTQKGYRYLCVGINDKTNSRFWLYEKDSILSQALNEYKTGGAANVGR